MLIKDSYCKVQNKSWQKENWGPVSHCGGCHQWDEDAVFSFPCALIHHGENRALIVADTLHSSPVCIATRESWLWKGGSCFHSVWTSCLYVLDGTSGNLFVSRLRSGFLEPYVSGFETEVCPALLSCEFICHPLPTFNLRKLW